MGASSNSNLSVKFLCSYGGRILPRYPDGKLRYHGGQNRVLSVDISISFADLLVKMGEMCGSSVTVSLRCQLPTEDLDALVSITSDEDLAHLIEEYDCATSAAAAPPLSFKMRVFLPAPKTDVVSPPKSPPPKCPVSATRRFNDRSSRPPPYPSVSPKVARKNPNQLAYQFYNGQANGCAISHLIHKDSGNIWQ